MIFNKYARALASAALLAIALVGVSGEFAHAKTWLTQEYCERAGYRWTGNQCADVECRWDGQSYKDGQAIRVNFPSGSFWLVCDGVTGNWTQSRAADPQGPLNPQAPRPTTNGR